MFSDETYPDFAILRETESYHTPATEPPLRFRHHLHRRIRLGKIFWFREHIQFNRSNRSRKERNTDLLYIDGERIVVAPVRRYLNATGIYRGIVPVGENPLVNAFMTTENTMVVFDILRFHRAQTGWVKCSGIPTANILAVHEHRPWYLRKHQHVGQPFHKRNANIAGNETVYGVLTCDSSAVINEMTVNGIATFNGTIQAYSDISCPQTQ
jgi:hypothetical protein